MTIIFCFFLSLQKVQHEHPINKISFITHDPDDKRTFGYVCSQPCTTGHKLYAIKSEKPVSSCLVIITQFPALIKWLYQKA